MFTPTHARVVGLTREDIRFRLASGRWTSIYRGVFRQAGTPLTWHAALLGACWAGGFRAAASHRSAARLWNLPGGRDDPLEIVCPRWRRAQHDGLVVHETKALSEFDLTQIDGIPVTDAARTLLDLGAVCGPRTVELAFENALRRDLVTTMSLRAMLRRVGRQGRNGVGVLRALLDERDPERAASGSDMETRLLQVLRENGLPEPVPQFEIYDGPRFVARVDAAYPRWKIAIEHESYQEHTGKRALLRDNPRRNALVAWGWTSAGRRRRGRTRGCR